MTESLELVGISKSFDGFPALRDASFSARTGELHALLGENGAGKSSLMNVAAGLYTPDTGTIRVGGRAVTIDGPIAARIHGIGMVHQHYKLVKSCNALENIVLAGGGKGYARSLAAVEAAVRRQRETLGFEVDLDRPVGNLSIAEQQRVEILKVLVNGAGILILDEPTAVLTESEAEGLLDTVKQLARQGATVVLVTHKLGEVLGHADRVTIMRRGTDVGTDDPATLSAADLTRMVVGSSFSEVREPAAAIGEPVLEVEGVSGARADGYRLLTDASFVIRSGEIFGIAGVGGNGQTELAEILMGVRAPMGGRLVYAGAGDITALGAARRRRLGIVAIPSDRQQYGLAGELSIADNYAVKGMMAGDFGNWFRVDSRRIAECTDRAVRDFDVQGVRSQTQKAALLSGGNAQKLVIAREFSTPPRLVLAHSPSRGLDMRAANDVHRYLREARDAGAGVLLISEDLDEIELLADRIGVMSRGRIVSEFEAPADRQAIGAAMVHHV